MAGEQPKTFGDTGGDRQVIASGGEHLIQSGGEQKVEGTVNIESGGKQDIKSGATLDLNGQMDVAVGGIISLGDAAGLSFAAAALLTANAGTLTIPSLPSNAVSANVKKWIEFSIGGDTYYVPAIKKT